MVDYVVAVAVDLNTKSAALKEYQITLRINGRHGVLANQTM